MTVIVSIAAHVLAIVGVTAAIVLAALAIERDRPAARNHSRARYSAWFAAASVFPVFAIILGAAAWPTAPAAPGLLTATLVLALATLGVVAGSPLVALVLRLATRGTVPLGIHGGILVRDASTPAPDREILRGGATIGYLERFALIGSVMAGQAAAVAVIVAIKGLGRFSELENEEARERFIIGTLASLTWAGACVAAILLVW